MDLLKRFEIELHQETVRMNAARVTELLHPNYIEVGYSGRTYDFESTLNSISKLPPDFVIWSQNYEYFEYAPDVIQLIYLSVNVDDQENLSRYAKRTSIWVNYTGKWQMKYHQATPIDPFEKSHA